jgi:peptidoglycan L-alanyl-D-glutamate endopeptidase CwlK
MFKFSSQSLKNLETCDPQLIFLCKKVMETQVIDFSIIEGHRSKENQDKAVIAGSSLASWPDSKHNSRPSLAVDIAPYPIDWSDKARFTLLAGLMFGVAASHGILIKWGGHWSLQDMPHFELNST